MFWQMTAKQNFLHLVTKQPMIDVPRYWGIINCKFPQCQLHPVIKSDSKPPGVMWKASNSAHDYSMNFQSLQKCLILCDTSYHERICGLGWATKPNVRFSRNSMESLKKSKCEFHANCNSSSHILKISKFHDNQCHGRHTLLERVNEILLVSNFSLSDLDMIC